MDKLNPQLLEQLRHYAARGVDFDTAKAGLLNAGWLTEDIDAAKASVEFSSAPAKSLGTDATLTSDQAAGLAVAQDKFTNDRRRERNETIMAAVVATPQHPLGVQYMDKLYDNLGLSWWSLFAVGAPPDGQSGGA